MAQFLKKRHSMNKPRRTTPFLHRKVHFSCINDHTCMMVQHSSIFVSEDVEPVVGHTQVWVLFIQTIGIIFLVALLPGGIGFFLKNWLGAAIGFSGVVIMMAAVAMTVEKRMIRFYRAVSTQSLGLMQSLRGVMQQSCAGMPIPRFYTYVDPIPRFCCIRAWGSQGTILMSQGLLARLDEEELRKILKLSVFKLNQSTVFLYTFYSVLIILCLQWVPPSWRKIFFQKERMIAQTQTSSFHPLTTLKFLLFLPWVQFFLSIQAKLNRIDEILYLKECSGINT